ncbi:MAG: succinylglutamate desuccinylase/aspartoacylase family protein [Cyclobacteriaceae bacterium]
MEINGHIINPGETKKVVINIAKLPSHSLIDISITVSRAVKPGPVLLLSGGLHGDEINGIEIVRRMIDEGRHIPEIGTTICIPVINVYGFIHFSRYVPDGKDVNRSFPGRKNGSLASRVAHYLVNDIIPIIDYGVDFHTGGADRTNYPQIRAMMDDPVNLELAKAFHPPFILHSSYRAKSFRQSASRKSKKILVYEGGESARFDEFAIQQGVDGAVRLMHHLGMVAAPKKSPEFESLYLDKSGWVRAKVSGIFQAHVISGIAVTKNQLLGHITDPFGDFKIPVKSNYNGYIIGLNNNPIVHAGDAIVNIGRYKS